MPSLLSFCRFKASLGHHQHENSDRSTMTTSTRPSRVVSSDMNENIVIVKLIQFAFLLRDISVRSMPSATISGRRAAKSEKRKLFSLSTRTMLTRPLARAPIEEGQVTSRTTTEIVCVCSRRRRHRRRHLFLRLTISLRFFTFIRNFFCPFASQRQTTRAICMKIDFCTLWTMKKTFFFSCLALTLCCCLH